MTANTHACYLVMKVGKEVIARVESIPQEEFPPGEVTIQVEWSSLNYKDALAATGHPGVVKKFPHVPGVDAAGTVVESSVNQYKPGQKVLVTGYDLGAGHWGGWAEIIRVPAEWIVPLPEGLTTQEAMIFGTAGFTAAQSIYQLIQHGITPERGPILVTGATGGVGSLAVMILAKLGYRVSVVTGKADRAAWLKDLGAAEILDRSALTDDGKKPLLSALWAGAVDTIGGPPLAHILRSILPGGCVTCCGLVAGTELPLTVYPFILRGITLCGIDSAYPPRSLREEIWQLLASDWKPDLIASLATTASLSSLSGYVQQILAGNISGRVVVQLK